MSKKYVDKVTKKVFKKENELLEQQQYCILMLIFYIIIKNVKVIKNE